MANILKPRSPFKTISKLMNKGPKATPKEAAAARDATSSRNKYTKTEGGTPASRKPMAGAATPMMKPTARPVVKPKPKPRPGRG